MRLYTRIFITIHLYILTSIVCKNSAGELGDGYTSDQSRDGFFAELDNNANGQISLDELREYIEDTGGNSLDEQSEIQNAVSSVLNNLDGNKDMILKKDDLAVYWQSLASLLPTDEVAEWVAHSQLMPESIVASFIENEITGYDFPELIENDGYLLEQELEIRRMTIKRRLLRGMKMKLLGMGRPPLSPTPPAVVWTDTSKCFTHIAVEWETANNEAEGNKDVYPVHKYLLQRQDLDYTSTHPGKPRWITVYDGMDTRASDTILVPPELPNSLLSLPVTQTYRLSSWNVIGRSDYMYLKLDLPRPTEVSSDSCDELAFTQLSPIISPVAELRRTSHHNSHSSNTSTDISEQIENSETPTDLSVYTSVMTHATSPNGKQASNWTAKEVLLGVYRLFSVAIGLIFRGSSWLMSLVYVLSILATFTISLIRLRNMKKYSDSDQRSATTSRRQSAVKGESMWGSVVTCCQMSLLKPSLAYLCPIVYKYSRDFGNTRPWIQPLTNYVCLVTKSLLTTVSRDSSPAPLTKQPSSRSNATQSARHPSGNSSGYSSCDDDGSFYEDALQNDTSGDLRDEDDDHKFCSVCKVKFKFKPHKMKWRKRHHCCKCLNVFCSRCGVVRHSSMLQCPVPGSCTCMRCEGFASTGQLQCQPAMGIGMVSRAAMQLHNHSVETHPSNVDPKVRSDATKSYSLSSNRSLSMDVQDSLSPPKPKKDNPVSRPASRGFNEQEELIQNSNGVKKEKKGHKKGSRSFGSFKELSSMWVPKHQSDGSTTHVSGRPPKVPLPNVPSAWPPVPILRRRPKTSPATTPERFDSSPSPEHISETPVVPPVSTPSSGISLPH